MATAIGIFNAITGQQVLGGSPPSYTFSDEYLAFKSYLEGQTIDLPNEAGQKADDQLIKDLKDAGLWSKIDAIWNFTTAGVAAYALVNLKSPGDHTATLHGTTNPSYVAKEGFHGNAAQSAYINFHWTPSTDGINFLQNDASVHYFTIDGEQRAENIIGTTNASSVGRIFLTHRTTSDQVRVYLNTFSSATGGTGGAGLVSAVRTNSANQQGYLNGSQQATDTDESNGISAHPLLGFAYNNNGTPDGFSDSHLGLVIVGSSAITPSVLDSIWDAHLLRIAALPSSLLNGLIHAWHLDEEGTTTSDLRLDSVGGIHLTPSASLMTQAAGKSGLAYTNDGSLRFLSVDSDDMRDIVDGSFTFSVWFKLNVLTDAQAILGCWNAFGVNERSYLLWFSPTVGLRWILSAGGDSLTGESVIEVNTAGIWYHAIFGWD